MFCYRWPIKLKSYKISRKLYIAAMLVPIIMAIVSQNVRVETSEENPRFG
jgi:ferric iron reductase protein FhuF